MTEDNPSLKILVVEDNLTQAKYLAHLLEAKNHRVTLASNGNEALVQIEGNEPDIVLTDVMMPDMDGYTLCRRIKEDEKRSHIPVIIVTHLYSPVDVIKGLEAGADNFIIKPYVPENIFSRIVSIVQVRDHPDSIEKNPPLNVVFSNEVHAVSSSRMQILNILLSTYDTAVKNNCELQVAHERLHYMNAQLQKAVEDLQQSNETLHVKTLQQDRIESDLVAANEKIHLLSDGIDQFISPHFQHLVRLLSSAPDDENPEDLRGNLVLAGNSMQRFIRVLETVHDFLGSGVQPRKWQGIRNLVHVSAGRINTGLFKVVNHIPEDVELFVDSGIGRSFERILWHLREKSPAAELRISFHVLDNGYSIVIESGGNGNDTSSFSPGLTPEEIHLVRYDLLLISRIFQNSGLVIQGSHPDEPDLPYTIFCPGDSVRFRGTYLPV